MTDIYIISGFLGAGKTTWIQKMLKESFQGKKVMLIENDFGEISVDVAVLRESGYQVKELSSGCICCSLTSDFATVLPGILKEFHPDVIVIEPSGVGKLSKVGEACRDKKIAKDVRIARKITVVDAKRCERYLQNFGEFFRDQVAYADTILCSHAEKEDAIKKALVVIRNINPQAVICTQNWDCMTAEEILNPPGETLKQNLSDNLLKEEVPHGHGCHCGCHYHAAENSFDTVTIYFQRKVNMPEIAELLQCMETAGYGTVLRAKGILKSRSGFYNLQFLPGDLKVEQTDAKGNVLSIIGSGLCREKITALFAQD